MANPHAHEFVMQAYGLLIILAVAVVGFLFLSTLVPWVVVMLTGGIPLQ